MIKSILCNNKGAVIALFIAAVIHVSSEVIFHLLGEAQPVYVYYVALFLLMFSWWIITERLKLRSSQIVAGLACSFSSLLVVDCYFSGGYETMLSIADQYVFTLINIATIWAAFDDRNWTYNTNSVNRVEHINKNDKANHRC